MESKINLIKVMFADKGKTNKLLSGQKSKNHATFSLWCTNMAKPAVETTMRIVKVL